MSKKDLLSGLYILDYEIHFIKIKLFNSDKELKREIKKKVNYKEKFKLNQRK